MKSKNTALMLITGMFILIFISCGKSRELTKTMAIELIKKEFHLPVSDETWITDGFSPKTPGYTELLNLEYITVREDHGYFYYHSHYSVTDLGKEYFIKEKILNGPNNRKDSQLYFTSHTVDISDVSVSSNAKQKTAEVLVTMKIVPTPFGEYLDGFKDGMTFQKPLNFKLYSDGWKIVRDNQRKTFLIYDVKRMN